MSDLPIWVGAAGAVGQALTGVGQLYLGVRVVRQHAASEFGRLVDEMLDLPPDEIVDLLQHDHLAEIVGYAWEGAARVASEKKRWMLARIAVAALKGETDDAEVDPLPMLLRTIESIDEPHIRLLVLIATPPPVGTGSLAGTALDGFVRVDDLERRWPGATGLVKPILAALERENLIEDRATGTWGYQPTYAVSAYGRRFLSYLPGKPLPELAQAQLTVTMPSTAELLIQNVGLSRAAHVTLSDAGWDIPFEQRSDLFEPSSDLSREFDVAPGEARTIAIRSNTLQSPPYRLTMTWTDSRGEQTQQFWVGDSQ